MSKHSQISNDGSGGLRPCGQNGLCPYRKRIGWVECDHRRYLAHTALGQSLREVARTCGCEPSTVLRNVRRVEQRRDDPACDVILDRLSQIFLDGSASDMTPDNSLPDDDILAAEGARVLRRLAEPGTVLAIAPGMDTSVVVREMPDGRTIRLLSLDRAVAQAFVLKDWVQGKPGSKVTRYRLAAAGRAWLRTLSAKNTEAQAQPEDEAQALDRRYVASDTPLAALSRRRQPDGTPFLDERLVSAGERLREDFEIAKIGRTRALDWDSFVTAPVNDGLQRRARAGGAAGAEARVATALSDLGPGLGDVALRCCCYLEGLEQAERQLGWSARSGKVVLRIALERLKKHYDDLGEGAAMIG